MDGVGTLIVFVADGSAAPDGETLGAEGGDGGLTTLVLGGMGAVSPRWGPRSHTATAASAEANITALATQIFLRLFRSRGEVVTASGAGGGGNAGPSTGGMCASIITVLTRPRSAGFSALGAGFKGRRARTAAGELADPLTGRITFAGAAERGIVPPPAAAQSAGDGGAGAANAGGAAGVGRTAGAAIRVGRAAGPTIGVVTC